MIYPSKFHGVNRSLGLANSERDLRAIKSLHYEKLVGDRSGQRSLRLGGQFRLIVTPVKDEQGDIIWIIEIADYH